MKTPITIITGYLGAGKTTLLRNILEHSQKRIAVIMNEFGEIAIDSKIIKGKNVDIAELSGGCVCCSITGEFEAALKEIREKVRPEHVILETTGVADPEAIIYDVKENLPEVRLDSVITIADAYELTQFPSLGETAKSQICLADVILINKADLVNEEHLREVEKIASGLNNSAILFRTTRCGIDTNLLFGFHTEKEAEHKLHEDLEMEHFIFSSEKILDKNKFMSFAKSMHKYIYRAKGFVVLDGKGYLFNYVNGRHELEEWKADKTELVFIGRDAGKAMDEIVSGLRDCEIT